MKKNSIGKASASKNYFKLPGDEVGQDMANAALFSKSRNSEKVSRSCWEWLTVVLLAVWAFRLHIHRLMCAGALWRDEISSIKVASAANWHDFYLAQKYDSFPLFNVFLLRIWMMLKGGTLAEVAANDTYLRMFGMLGGLVLLGVIVWSAMKVFNSLPVFSLALFALSPSVIQWGDSIRAYSLGAALSVLFMGMMWRLLHEPSLKKFILCTLVAVLMVWTLYGNAFFVLAICIAASAVALSRRDWGLLLKVVGIGFVAALSLLLNFKIFSEMGILKEAVAQYITLQLITKSWWDAWSESGAWFGVIWLLAIGLSVVVALKILCGSQNSAISEKSREFGVYILLILVLSIGGFLCYLQIVDVPPQVWYFIPIGAVVSAAVDGLWPMLGRRKVVLPIQIGLCIVLTAITASGTFKAQRQKLTNLDLVADLMRKRAREGDLIIIAPLYPACSLVRYYHGPAKVQVWPPHKPDELAFQRVDVLLSAMHSKEEAIPPLLEDIGLTLRNGGRVWMMGDIVVVPGNQPPPWVQPGTQFLGQSQVGPYLYTWGAQVFHYLVNNAKSATVTDELDVSQVNRWEAIRQVVVFDGWNKN